MNAPVIYGTPELYDLAFSYRDYPAECEFLLQAYQKRRGRPARSVLELAAGPSRHAIELARAGLAAHALDLSPEMMAYAARTARSRGVELTTTVADMRAFRLAEPVDLVACMLCSASHLLTDDDFVAHLRAVRATLADGGVYVMELALPVDGADAPTKETWTMADDAGVLDVAWVSQGQDVDVSGVAAYAVRFAYRPTAGPAVVIEDESIQRTIDAADLGRLLAASGGFAEPTLCGALDESVALDDPRAWRLVAIVEAV
jgi:SAM-dependent methyltransferase